MTKMATLTQVFLLVFLGSTLFIQVEAVIRFPGQILTSTNGVCPLQEQREEIRRQVSANLTTLIQNEVLDLLIPCGGSGWVRVAYLNMSDPSQSCPSAWRLFTAPQRGCGKQNGPRCDGVTYSSNGMEYSQVCGRIFAFPQSTVQAFRGGQRSIDSYYVDGVSITHGSPRQHIWSFAAGNVGNAVYICPCDGSVDPRVPAFVGYSYFCEGSQVSVPGSDTDVILWDGKNCLPDSDCCTFNTPPVFTIQLPATTNDDLEVRICSGATSAGGFNAENTPITLMEIYVK